MRVVVVCHKSHNTPLKVFGHDGGNGWDRAEEWLEGSSFGRGRCNISSAKVN